MNNLNQLRDRVFEINKANGWHEEKRTFGELIALVHSEVSEALEDYRAGHPINKVWYEYTNWDGKKLIMDVNRHSIYDPRHDKLEMKLGKPCGIPSELADIVIRILDICGLYGWDIESHHNHEIDTDEYKKLSFVELLTEIHVALSNAYNNGQLFGIGDLDTAIQIVELICHDNINLESIIEEKLAYNATRGYKHGGKVI